MESKLDEIREVIKRERRDLRRMFVTIDKDRSNYLSYDEFIREMSNFYPRITRYELEDLARYLDINHDGKIFYHEFVGRIMVEEIDEINAKVADFIRKNNVEFEEILSEMDYRGDKCLNFDQFLEALNRMNLPLAREESYKFLLENPLHRTRDNRFSYADLLERLPLMDEITKIYEQIRKACQDKMVKVNEIFEKYDVNNDKALSQKMFFEAFSSMGGTFLKSSDYTRLIESLPKAKDGKILYKEFIKKLKPPKKKKVMDLYARLKQEIQSKNLNFLENLRSFDTYGDKMIAKAHLKEIFLNNSIGITDEDLDFIWSEFDTKKTNLINYVDFFNRIKPKYKEPKRPVQKEIRKEPHWAQRYLDEVQRYLKETNMKIKDLFAKFDRDHSNSVSAEEFTDALREVRVNIPYQEMQKLIDELISKADGQISLTRFEQLFPEYLEIEKKLDNMYYALRKMMSEKRMDLKNIFANKDREAQGYLSTADFLDCIRQINPDFTPADLRVLADALDTRRSNRIYYREFSKNLEVGGVELVNMKMREFLISSRVSLVKSFESSMKNDYFLTAQVIRSVLESMHLPLSPEEIAMLIHDNNLSRSQDGRLSVKDLADRIGVRELFPEPRPAPAAIYEKVRKIWQQNRTDPIRIFKEFDYEKDMFLTRSNFVQAMTFGGSPLTNIEIDVLWEVIEKSQDGRASVEHFIRLVNGIDSSSDSIFVKIYSFCEQNRIELNPILIKFDTDNDRQITMFEMENALKSIKLMLTDHEYRSVFIEIDRGRTGRAYIADLMQRVMRDAPRVDLNALQWAAPILSSILESLNNYKMDAVTYFRRYNVTQDGLIGLQEFRDALYKLGVDPAAAQPQRLINFFKVPNKDSVRFKDFELALRNLGKFQAPPPTRQPDRPGTQAVRFRVLSRAELDELYSCLDYISSVIKGKKITVTAYIEGKFPVSIAFEDLKILIKIDLSIPSHEDVLENICILLDGGKGFIPRNRLIDALSSVRIEQILDGKADQSRYDPPTYQQHLSVPDSRYNPPQLSNTRGDFTQSQQFAPISIMKPANPLPPTPLKLLSDYLSLHNITLAKLLGKDSGAAFPKAAFVKTLRDDRIMKDTEINELAASIAVPGDKIDLTKLSAMLADLARPSIRMDPYLLFKESLREARISFPQLFGTAPTIHRDSFAKAVAGIKLDPSSLNTILAECKARDPNFIDLQSLSIRMEGREPELRPPPGDPNSNVLAQLNQELEREGLSAEELFTKYDIDGDGELSVNEFIQAFKSMRTIVPDQKLAEAFDLIDVNKNKSLSINEIAMKIPGARMNLERRLTGLDLGARFEEEVKQIFDLLDKDKDGSIDYSEIVMGIKAYCGLPSQSQIKDIMNNIDKNHNGKIEYEEFKGFIEETVKREILKEEDAMQDLRMKFMQADIMKVGYLTPAQLFSILQSTKADVTQDELNHLLTYVDANHDNKIDIDEFMLLMTGASPEVFSDPKASAVMFNIRQSRKISPLEFFKMFQGMPQHFLPSFISEQQKMKKILPSSSIVPALDTSGLQFRDVNPTAQKGKLDSLTYLKQNPVTAGGYISLELASGISIPDGSIVQRSCILKRFVERHPLELNASKIRWKLSAYRGTVEGKPGR